ncbi:uncharacterized endoplasmic reticulum membrane protein C16E8.02 [Vigna radiata var. radiata]|uniref:Uncharacterized endoplasmic reticulum membrane protein C16E8.02 n=1 Tax=Vigna radiata var. radiata TaxID=3916 RepID=A0A1S3TM74_VIGRR|nr:uncharacterized endoplasmic reticulum membrane protein C16E8.02 [Vigna radiata var. radiata]
MFLGRNDCVWLQVSRGMFMPRAVERRKTAFSSRILNQPSNTAYPYTWFHTSTTTTTTFFSQPIQPKKLIITNFSSSDSHQPFIKNSESKMGFLDLEKHFAFYGAYHSNPINVGIHILFVWPILFTAQIILYFTPSLLSLGFLPPVLVLNWGFFATVFYALFYMALDTKAGSFTAFLTFFCWVASSFVANNLGYSLAWKVVLAAQLFCWTGQFIGHGVFEKRAPALLDNLTQAFLMAPYFVVLEILQSNFGYEPYPGFKSRVKARIDSDIKQWHDKKQKKHS